MCSIAVITVTLAQLFTGENNTEYSVNYVLMSTVKPFHRIDLSARESCFFQN